MVLVLSADRVILNVQPLMPPFPSVLRDPVPLMNASLGTMTVTMCTLMVARPTFKQILPLAVPATMPVTWLIQLLPVFLGHVKSRHVMLATKTVILLMRLAVKLT